MDIAVGSINAILWIEKLSCANTGLFELLAFHPVKRQGEKN